MSSDSDEPLDDLESGDIGDEVVDVLIRRAGWVGLAGMRPVGHGTSGGVGGVCTTHGFYYMEG